MDRRQNRCVFSSISLLQKPSGESIRLCVSEKKKKGYIKYPSIAVLPQDLREESISSFEEENNPSGDSIWPRVSKI
ncbi:hypothetical protein TNCV_2238541 [Trichonephila clavipes]|nr:hypothetical protein TNCV_2238541 [Trichonephila clavipes]